MNKHIKYFSYVVRHKWYVLHECVKKGIPIQGILHDLSKLLPDEWFPYVNYFHGPKKQEKTPKVGYMKRATSGDREFDEAWLRHIHRNPHHWQHYTLAETNGSIKIFEMPIKYRKEMIADWKGAGKAQGHGDDVKEWYAANKHKILLGKKTKAWVEKRLGVENE
jgi:hypothetical protein